MSRVPFFSPYPEFLVHSLFVTIVIHANVLNLYVCRYKQNADTRATILQKQLNRYARVSLGAEV